MQGVSAPDQWGDLPLVIDTSAWARAIHPQIRERWDEALFGRRFRLSPIAAVEILVWARDGDEFDDLAASLALLHPAPLDASIARAAEAAMRAMAHRSAGTHRISVTDYFIAAAAESLGAAVLHYDRDYDKLAEVMTFESVWIAPPGSVP